MKKHTFKVQYVKINREKHPALDAKGEAHPQAGEDVHLGTRASTDHSKFVVASTPLIAGDHVVKTYKDDADEIQVQAVSQVAGDVDVADEIDVGAPVEPENDDEDEDEAPKKKEVKK